jgi:Resolvase, N terminal domain/Helix-turn-helix domain of resolvase
VLILGGIWASLPKQTPIGYVRNTLLAKGDVLVVTRLDRLARSTRDLLNLLGTIGEKEAGFKSLRDTWANTTTAHGRLMLTMLGGLAEFERELIRTRTGEGRERAKARGVILGRKPKLTGHQRREAIARREAGEVLTDIARSYNVSHSTISRLVWVSELIFLTGRAFRSEMKDDTNHMQAQDQDIKSALWDAAKAK